jgi:alanine racemase
VLVEGERVPIAGRICMDQCMVRLPRHVPIGTTVTLIGSQLEEFISVNEIASSLDTINYEVPCMISSRVPRIYRKGGQIVDLKNYLLHD